MRLIVVVLFSFRLRRIYYTGDKECLVLAGEKIFGWGFRDNFNTWPHIAYLSSLDRSTFGFIFSIDVGRGTLAKYSKYCTGDLAGGKQYRKYNIGE